MMTGVFMKKRNLDTGLNIGTKPCEHRDGIYEQKRKKGPEKNLASKPSEGAAPADTLILDN